MQTRLRNQRDIAVIVMGVTGSGKSTVGLALANALNAPFLEGDGFHPQCNIAKMSSGIALQDEDRWPWLDVLGTALGAAVRKHGLAVAACSALKRSYRDRLRIKSATPSLLISLRADPEIIRQRMTTRPGHFMPASLLNSQLETFEAPDATEDALDYDCNEPADRIVQSVCEQIAQRRSDPLRT